MVAGPAARPAPPPSLEAQRHPGIPDRGYIICHFCLNWATREENEISRHYMDRRAHADATPQWAARGATPYHLCRIVPSRVAAALIIDAKGQPEKLPKANKFYEVVRHNTKAKPATVEEMQQMFRVRMLAEPAWLTGVRPVRVPGWEEGGDEDDDDNDEEENEAEAEEDEDMVDAEDEGEGEGEEADEVEDEFGSPDDEDME